MVKKSKFRRRARSRPAAPAAVASRIFGFLESWGGSGERARLVNLWHAWEKVMGEEIAALGKPLGHRGEILLLGANDALEMQELSLLGEEILEKANNFLGTKYFTRLKPQLAGAKKPLQLRKRRTAGQTPRTSGAPAAASGKFLSGMDMNSPVARCYARFAKAGNNQARQETSG